MPLFIAHPLSPFKGQHYTEPVELVDIYPTVNDLLKAPYDKSKVCVVDTVCHPLQGKSLAKVVLGGDKWHDIELAKDGKKKRKKGKGGKRRLLDGPTDVDFTASEALLGARIDEEDWAWDVTGSIGSGNTTIHARQLVGAESDNGGATVDPTSVMSTPKLDIPFAMTQSWRCASKPRVMELKNTNSRASKSSHVQSFVGNLWVDGDKTKNPPFTPVVSDDICVMGYSMRASEFRYTGWFHYNRYLCVPIMDVAPFDEEVSSSSL